LLYPHPLDGIGPAYAENRGPALEGGSRPHAGATSDQTALVCGAILTVAFVQPLVPQPAIATMNEPTARQLGDDLLHTDAGAVEHMIKD